VEAEHLARIAEGEYLSLLDSGEPPEVLVAIGARLKRAEGELRLASGDPYGAYQLMMEAATALRENQDWAVLERVLSTFEGRDGNRTDRLALAPSTAARPIPALATVPAGNGLALAREATEGLAARVSSAVATRVQADIREALIPAPPVAFHGGIDAHLAGAVRDAGDSAPVWRVPVGHSCELTVTVTTGDRALAEAGHYDPARAEVSVPFKVADGRNASHVDVTVSADAPFLELSRTRLETSCRTDGGTVRFRATLRVSDRGRYDLCIALHSSGRLVQVLPIELATEEEPNGSYELNAS
jgi:hypothetical protein